MQAAQAEELRAALAAFRASGKFVVAHLQNDGVRMGMTALPNAVAGANAGLPLGDASGRVDIGKLLGTAWLTPGTAGTGGPVTTSAARSNGAAKSVPSWTQVRWPLGR